MKPRIAIIVQNVIQWYHIRPLAIFLSKQPNLLLDVYVYDPNSNTQEFHNIATDTKKAIIADRLNPIATAKDIKYKICIAPYSNMIDVNCQYKLGFCYGAATTKPSFTLSPTAKIGFHGLFLHDTYGAELFSIYGKTYLVPNLYLNGYKENTNHMQKNKPTILFLPTYHEDSTSKTTNALKELKNDFYIIAKCHHGTDNLNDEKTKKELISEVADELFPSTYPIQKLFQKADVVLSDNSGAVMDALYVNIPVVIAAPNINQSIAGINTLQFDLTEAGIIPYTNNPQPSTIKEIVTIALTKKQQEKQIKTSNILFPIKSGGVKAWYKIIQQYLNDEVPQNYCKAHDFLADKYMGLEKTNYELSLKISQLGDNLATTHKNLIEAQKTITEYENDRVYRLANKVRRILNRRNHF